MKPFFRSSSSPVHRALGLRLLFAVLIPGSALAQSAPAETPAAISWEALIREITARNPEREFYDTEIDAAKAGARIAGRRGDPELSLDLGQKRLKDASGARIDDGVVWSVSIAQTFEWPGRLALRKAIANRQEELAALGLARFEQALAARARVLAFGLQAAQAKADAIQEVADRFASLKETFLARDPAGLTPLLETRVIEAAELALQRRATEAGLAVQATLLELNQLRGAAIDAPLRVAAPTIRFTALPELSELLEAARVQNFEYRMRLAELEQQGFVARLARHERYPGIRVSPFLAQDKVGERETTVGVGLSLPLASPGRSAAAIDVADARHRQAEAAALVSLRELEREVVTAAQAFDAKVTEMSRWSPDTAQRFREAADLADRHYRTGALPVATYVELQTSYLDAIEALLDTEGEALAAGLRVQQLTGVETNLVEIRP